MITKEEVRKLSALSRISLTDKEEESLAKDMEGILAYVGEIKKVKIGDSRPWEPAERNIFREDKAENGRGEFKQVLLDSAPASENGFFKVKKIL